MSVVALFFGRVCVYLSHEFYGWIDICESLCRTQVPFVWSRVGDRL